MDTRPSLVVLVALVLSGCASVAPKPPASQVEISANLVAAGVPELSDGLVAEVARYQNSRAASLLGWVGDGILIATRFGDTTQLHRVEEPMAMRRQITFFTEPVGGATVHPDASRDGFVYLKDAGGSEFYQLFWRRGETGEDVRLSDGKSRYIGVSWSPSGHWLGYSTTAGDGVNWDLHAQDSHGERRILQQGEGVGWTIDDWSPDESRVLVSHYISVNESRIYEIDVASGARRRLFGDVTAAFGAVRYGAEDRLYFTADMDAEFMRLYQLDRRTGAVTTLTEDAPWDVETFAVSRDRQWLAYVLNEDGISRLTVLRLLDTGAAFTALPRLPQGILTGLRFHPESDRLGFTLRSATTPADVFSIDLTSRKLTRWTASELGGLRRANFQAPELVRYRTFDGRGIPAFVYRPASSPSDLAALAAKSDGVIGRLGLGRKAAPGGDGFRGVSEGPHPVIINIHGGPEGQARPGFSPTTQYYVSELGAAVIYPNVRGSSGYGKTYLQLDNGTLREDSVRDIGALLDWIAATPDLDENRVAVMGGSYGGYMVLASLVKYGDRLRAGVERVGISNFVTFLENTQPYRQDLRRVEYGDERDPAMRAFLQSISPLNNVADLTTPLLISQGLNDPRVPASESEQMVAALREQGVPVWYVLAKNEGHGFRKKANRDYLSAATALFLKQWLLER